MSLRVRLISLFVFACSIAVVRSAFALDASEPDYALKLLGKYVFFDKISVPARMACATCHDPDTGGTGSVSGVNLHEVAITGANPHAIGGLKPPTNAYASLIPPFALCNRGGVAVQGKQYCGGNFWNGRAEGREQALLSGATRHIGIEIFQGLSSAQVLGYAKYIGGTSDQALNPMPSAAEQNIERKAVCEHVAGAKYAELYTLAWGERIDCSDRTVAVSAPDAGQPERAFDISFKRLMLAVGAWQHSSELNSFSSKRDQALRAELACVAGAPDADPAVCGDPAYLDSPGTFPLAGLSAQENLGHDLFYNTAFPRGPAPFPTLPVTNCSFCHISDTARRDGTGLLERYTDDAYHNIGVPVNPELPAAPDSGISNHAGLTPPADAGGFKTPTLRNVDKRKGEGFTKAYGHNGWFKSLESIVHFYNTSRVKPRCTGAVTEKVALANDCWPEPEWPATLATNRLVGAIGLTPEQEAALVAYLKTLTDTQTPTAPAPYKKK
ncbi:MAG TPA: cytochrome c peroxidase [Polyangiales bacterium]|nr:cytochrome c peroxidase [Polyangiales bacterium]